MHWNLTGTESQKAIAREGFAQIKFPWERLRITWKPELGWRDLNSGFYRQHEEPPPASVTEEAPRAHEGHYTPENEGEPEPLNGTLEGRRFTMGVFYPGSGRIYIDYRLERYPAMALATLGAEIAHAVDEFLPLTEDQRNDIIRLLGGVPGEMTWWEKSNYSTEYWTLAGEHFMPLFVDAYSEIPFGDTSSFQKDPTLVNPDDVVRIVGIQRTDYVAPTPAPPPPPEPVIQPEEEIIPVPDPEPPATEPPAPEPAPAPETHLHTYRYFGKSKVIHDVDHYPNKTNGTIVEAEHIPEGYRPCKVCKPH